MNSLQQNFFFQLLLRHGGEGFLGVDDLDEGVALLVSLAHVHGGLPLLVLDAGVGAVGHELSNEFSGSHRHGIHERRPSIFVHRVQINLLLDQLLWRRRFVA